jgi:FkbM family methyltransferase
MRLEANYMNVASTKLHGSARLSFDTFRSSFGTNPNVVFDIGACVGLYSLHIANMSKDLKVYSFEPVKESFNIFEKNIKLNDIENIIPINKGLYSENTQLNLSLPRPGTLPDRVLQSDGLPGLGRYSIFGDDNFKLDTADKNFLAGWHESVKPVLADFTTIDTISKEYDLLGADIIKMDCEGSEEIILKSSPNFFKKSKILYVEHHPEFDPDDRISTIIENYGFEGRAVGIDRIWINRGNK